MTDSESGDRRPPLHEQYARAFRCLLWRQRKPCMQAAVDALCAEIARAAKAGTPAPEAFAAGYRDTRDKTIESVLKNYGARPPDAAASYVKPNANKTRQILDSYVPDDPFRYPSLLECPGFHCDAALGGLARWLRAAGYEAAWWPGIEDNDLLRKVLHSSAILLTTNRRLMERGVIARGAVPALLVPISLRRREQFAFAIGELDLPLGAPRCMSCGGSLAPVEKESVRKRIPPRTYPWCDDYYLCSACDQLFWSGTHWQQIAATLSDVAKQRFSARSEEAPLGS